MSHQKRTVSSLEQTNAEFKSYQERGDEEYESDDEEYEVQESTHSPALNVSRTKVGKKVLHPVEDKILRSLDRDEKRAKKSTNQKKRLKPMIIEIFAVFTAKSCGITMTFKYTVQY